MRHVKRPNSWGLSLFAGACVVLLGLPGGGSALASEHATKVSGPEVSYLTGVSCASSSSCFAVGYYMNRSNEQAQLVEHWNGAAWAIEPVSNPPDAKRSLLQGVSCASRSSCFAVGQYLNGSATWVTLVERWNGTSWDRPPSPNPYAPAGSDLFGVSCPSSSACFAVGDYVTNARRGLRAMLAERWNGGHWAIQPSPSPSPTVGMHLYGVSCGSTS